MPVNYRKKGSRSWGDGSTGKALSVVSTPTTYTAVYICNPGAPTGGRGRRVLKAPGQDILEYVAQQQTTKTLLQTRWKVGTDTQVPYMLIECTHLHSEAHTKETEMIH